MTYMGNVCFVKAAREIQRGEPVTLNYLQSEECAYKDAYRRQEVLRRVRGIDECQCELCRYEMGFQVKNEYLRIHKMLGPILNYRSQVQQASEQGLKAQIDMQKLLKVVRQSKEKLDEYCRDKGIKFEDEFSLVPFLLIKAYQQVIREPINMILRAKQRLTPDLDALLKEVAEQLERCRKDVRLEFHLLVLRSRLAQLSPKAEGGIFRML